jgi:hypothetical protein
MFIKSLGKTIALELEKVFYRIDDSQVEAFIEAIGMPNESYWSVPAERGCQPGPLRCA